MTKSISYVSVLCVDGIENARLEEVLTDQTVGLFVGGALPRRVRMGEIELGIELFGDGGMARELLAVASAQGVYTRFERLQQANGERAGATVSGERERSSRLSLRVAPVYLPGLTLRRDL